MNEQAHIRTTVRTALLFFFLALTGCALPTIFGGPAGVRVSPVSSPDVALLNERFFFVEYLREKQATTTRVSVLLEPPKTRLAIVLNPERYDTGRSGVDKAGVLLERFAPMRFHSVRTSAGKHLGYALLRPGESLRALSVHEGRYWLELSRQR